MCIPYPLCESPICCSCARNLPFCRSTESLVIDFVMHSKGWVFFFQLSLYRRKRTKGPYIFKIQSKLINWVAVIAKPGNDGAFRTIIYFEGTCILCACMWGGVSSFSASTYLIPIYRIECICCRMHSLPRTGYVHSSVKTIMLAFPFFFFF